MYTVHNLNVADAEFIDGINLLLSWITRKSIVTNTIRQCIIRASIKSSLFTFIPFPIKINRFWWCVCVFSIYTWVGKKREREKSHCCLSTRRIITEKYSIRWRAKMNDRNLFFVQLNETENHQHPFEDVDKTKGKNNIELEKKAMWSDIVGAANIWKLKTKQIRIICNVCFSDKDYGDRPLIHSKTKWLFAHNSQCHFLSWTKRRDFRFLDWWHFQTRSPFNLSWHFQFAW